ncbi:hypothetical protein [Candidatus Pantoea floridensis]|uniref:Uncharacterized protein n=1 Tax=Candidatus Pantoea floridensis TaxID=1938870 RepID=A0A286DSG4_9GAMM|nr:hypothetical protein [Pantoea floridensis]PIF06924.1 hypothetical protein BX596_5224 [Enterobacteriaceae bacterium JKS000233]SOD61553.1 hypothetical protein SAMN06273570_5195 [Pantoea floridensis]
MLNKTLSVIARVGMVVFFIYALWPHIITLHDHAQSGNMTPVEWMVMIGSVLFAADFALALVFIAMLVAFSVFSAGVRVLKHHLTLILRDAASLPCGR